MASDSNGGGGGGVEVLQIDEDYEFSAPRFFDFLNEETKEDIQRAERWFKSSISYAPSPFMPKIKERRPIEIETLCDFGSVVQTQKESEPIEVCDQNNALISAPTNTDSSCRHDNAAEAKPVQQEVLIDAKKSSELITEVKPSEDSIIPTQATSFTNLAPMDNSNKHEVPSFEFPVPPSSNGGAVAATKTSTVLELRAPTKEVVPTSVKKVTIGACTPKSQNISTKGAAPTWVKNQPALEACTPKAQRASGKGGVATSSKKLSAKEIAYLVRQPSALKPKSKSPSVQASKSTAKKCVANRWAGSMTMKNAMTTDIAQENQAIKRQKLDSGRSRQILNVKTRVLPHKSRLGLTGGNDILLSGVKGSQEDTLVRKEITTFISAAEMVQKFQSGTRDLDFSQNRTFAHDDTDSVIQRRPKLTLTRPKEPALETAHRVRAVRVKSSAELEEEMLAKIPKFKARPLNKKILEAPSLPSLPRSTPQPPEFQEFSLKTMERANLHAETSSVVSSVDTASTQNQRKPFKLTEPRPPHLETSLRARPPRIKSSAELELEELEKIPKFKARPLDKKILESKGDVGLFSNLKPQITTPQEFHFATKERLGPPASVVDLFDKLSLHSESSHCDTKEVPRITIPNPFHLRTEERGHEKERQFSVQILQKQLEEEKARVPKANPYPYTTDYPVVPPKPESKPCTKPEAFQLESLIRHEEEMQRKLEEKERMEKEEAQSRIFKAQPILKEDPIPLPERERKPLTEVQQFVLHVDHRALERSEFDNKIKEKETMYKRLREEYETAKTIEEEKAVKQMRRTMVPHARPLPKFDNPFVPQKSTKEGTKPKSPELRVNQRGQRRRTFYMR